MQPFKHPGQITKGIGKLTPQVWRGLTDSAAWISKNLKDLEEIIKLHRKSKQYQRQMFLAQLYAAKRIGNNQYLYAWNRVQLSGVDASTAYNTQTDVNHTSTFGTDIYSHGAINLMEATNTNTKVAPGINTYASAFPSNTFFMNPIGGHPSSTAEPPKQALYVSVNLEVQPVVVMYATREVTAGNIRYYFCNSNTVDGDECD